MDKNVMAAFDRLENQLSVIANDMIELKNKVLLEDESNSKIDPLVQEMKYWCRALENSVNGIKIEVDPIIMVQDPDNLTDSYNKKPNQSNIIRKEMENWRDIVNNDNGIFDEPKLNTEDAFKLDRYNDRFKIEFYQYYELKSMYERIRNKIEKSIPDNYIAEYESVTVSEAVDNMYKLWYYSNMELINTLSKELQDHISKWSDRISKTKDVIPLKTTTSILNAENDRLLNERAEILRDIANIEVEGMSIITEPDPEPIPDYEEISKIILSKLKIDPNELWTDEEIESDTPNGLGNLITAYCNHLILDVIVVISDSRHSLYAIKHVINNLKLHWDPKVAEDFKIMMEYEPNIHVGDLLPKYLFKILSGFNGFDANDYKIKSNPVDRTFNSMLKDRSFTEVDLLHWIKGRVINGLPIFIENELLSMLHPAKREYFYHEFKILRPQLNFTEYSIENILREIDSGLNKSKMIEEKLKVSPYSVWDKSKYELDRINGLQNIIHDYTKSLFDDVELKKIKNSEKAIEYVINKISETWNDYVCNEVRKVATLELPTQTMTFTGVVACFYHMLIENLA